MRLLKFCDFINESEVKSKKELNRLKYFVQKENEIIEWENLDKYGIPEKIKMMMKDWPVIQKSPYSDSFYSSTDIGWSHKPEGSYRVSDHWNFTTNRDGKSVKHCITDKSVPTTSHITIAQYRNGIYHVILSEPTEKQVEREVKQKEKLKYLKDPEVIYQKRLFKDRIHRGEVFGDITINGKTYKGRIFKYTGQEIKIVVADDKSFTPEVIFSENYLVGGPKFVLNLYDKQGNKIEDLLKR
jgi:hypothetical protein